MNHHSPPAEKIALFRSLFRGREDVYPLRFESKKTGKSGYQPACANQWARGLCDMQRVKCADCPNRRFIPLTDDVIHRHLSGQDEAGKPFIMGLYPMLLDDSCFLLVIDFDKASWQEDTAAYLSTCRRWGLPAALERSRSGHGGHVWLFFEEPVPAALARALASSLLTETMEQRPGLGLSSYDRLVPGQDTMPKGGLGNLIALPLQKLPREQGNSIFVDSTMAPFADQWAYLATLTKIARPQAEAIVREAEARGRVIGVRLAPCDEEDATPWSTPPSRRRVEPPLTSLPAHLELVLGDQIYLDKEGLPPGLQNRLLRLAAFQNPEFYKAQAMRLPAYGIPRVMACAEDYPQHIALPRGCLDEATALLSALKVRTTVRDERCPGVALAVSFHGELRPEQQSAALALAAHDTGVLAATTAFGKTVIAAWLIAQRGVNTLVVVHRRQLQEQWVERLSSFLGMPAKAIGRIGGGRKGATGGLDVAVIQSLVKKGVVDDCVANYGHLVVDECHHLSAHSFELVARRAKARFVTGLSATVTRKDGHHPIIFMQCGPVRHRVDAKAQALARPFSHSVLVRPTGFQSRREPDPDVRAQFQGLYEVQVYDYADLDVPMLARMFERRCRGYEAIGYTVRLPASAVPGWPAEVILPADPGWKQNYSASVRRLIRDGVDCPLAHLFLAAARPLPPEAEGAERARSASEAFLFRRLQGLPLTRDRFRLNEELAIPFDGRGRMEVDLLDADSRVAIELDGGQHLNDREAYRRDRRKDQLLQENGYRVLRFLAEDIAARLDEVLDAIQRALLHRQAGGQPVLG